MEPTRAHPIRRFANGRFTSLADPVVIEQRVELIVNDGQFRIGMLCLPEKLEALALGFLRGESIVRLQDACDVEVVVAGREIHVRGDFDADALDGIRRRWTWGSGCGGGGTGRDVDAAAHTPITSDKAVPAGKVLELFAAFNADDALWKLTGGVHGCALSDGRRLLVRAEDVGRHNAFDKIMGLAMLQGVAVTDKLVLTTGRLSTEIVSKAVACGVPILASRSSVSGLAVEVAKRFGQTLAGFVRSRRLNVYCGYERITES